MRADLHVHTYYSDGLQSPDDVALLSKNNGVELVAVTDHDTMLAYPELFACCENRGVKAVRGIEVSAYYNGVRLHTLGYNIDPKHPVFGEFLKELYEGSLIRTDDILSKLKKNGVKITMDEVLKFRKNESAPVHAMYISRAAAQKGYCSSAFAFQKNYLSNGACAYSELGRPTPEKAVEVITACSGFAVLAHPGRIELDKQDVISLVKRLVCCGLSGIEAVYSTHTQLETAYYKEMALEYGLLVTGGSDTHFKDGNKKIGTPVFDCGSELCEKFGI
ncbi:MAG: PHP domain-containing protein [Clostridia bacterium]|nr:PHP domain-containing protein [Clostridia bacterium]